MLGTLYADETERRKRVFAFAHWIKWKGGKNTLKKRKETKVCLINGAGGV